MTAVTTSRAAYHQHKGNNFAGQHDCILSKLRPGKLYSRRQIAKLTHMETSTVSARCFELRDAGMLVICGTLRCPITGINVQAVKLAGAQLELV